MASEAQISANRAHAQKSTGPRTAEGKAVVAQNAVQHGLLARAAVLQGEDWEEYTCFHEEMMDELYPDSLQEEELAGRIVDLTWRLRRAGRYQNAVFEALYDQYAAEVAESAARPDPGPSVPSDPVLGRMLLADFSGDRVLERVLQYERRIESSLYRTRAELRQLRRQPRTSAPRGASSYDRRWDDSGGHRCASPAARADLTRETTNSAWAAGNPSCETKPISGGSGRKRQVPGEASRTWNPPVPSLPDRIPSAAVPTSDATSDGTHTNVPEGQEQAGETRRPRQKSPIRLSTRVSGRISRIGSVNPDFCRARQTKPISAHPVLAYF